MFHTRLYRVGWLCFGLSLGALSAWHASAQLPRNFEFRDDEETEERRGKDPYAALPERFRNALESDDLRRSKPSRPIVEKQPIPWTDEQGNQLVGVVENRHLTKAQLKARVDIVLRNMPKQKDPIKAEDERIITESRLLKDWLDLTVLSTHAERSGFTATDAEVNEAMQRIAADHVREDVGDAQKQLRMIGFPEELLRQEVRDGLLVEKLVNAEIHQLFTPQQMRQIYERNPDFFLKPTRFRVWEIFKPVIGRIPPDQQEVLRKTFDKYAKQLRRCKSDEDYAKLVEQIKAEQPPNDPSAIVMRDLEWVSDVDPLPESMLRALFATKPGEVSPLVASKASLNIIKVLEREEGGRGTFEEAIPQIESSLFEKTREGLATKAMLQYKVFSDASGLNKWVEVKQAEAASEPNPLDQLTTASTTRPSVENEPDLTILRPRAVETTSDNLDVIQRRNPSANRPKPANATGSRRKFSDPPPVSDVLSRNERERTK